MLLGVDAEGRDGPVLVDTPARTWRCGFPMLTARPTPVKSYGKRGRHLCGNRIVSDHRVRAEEFGINTLLKK